jgi:exosome complex RNA-binding protein Rrp4
MLSAIERYRTRTNHMQDIRITEKVVLEGVIATNGMIWVTWINRNRRLVVRCFCIAIKQHVAGIDGGLRSHSDHA